MLNKKSIELINKSRFNAHFIKPRYSDYCFSNIPLSVESFLIGNNQHKIPADAFGGKYGKYDKVILFFIDAFGWLFFEKYKDRFPFIKEMLRNGVVSKITSQFPSTTAAHVTSIHTGQDVGTSGIYEWNMYDPKVDDVICPLLFSYAGSGKTRDNLFSSGIKPKDIYPKVTFYNRLKKQGIQSFVFQLKDYTPSTYSDIVFDGASVHPYSTLPEALVNLLGLVKKTQKKSYFFLYFDRIDSIAHLYGPDSDQVNMQSIQLLSVLEEFLKKLKKVSKNTLFMMTADHGQVNVSPQNTTYINKEFNILDKLKKNKKGKYIVPCGSPRDMFLHVKDEYVEEVIDMLNKGLRGKGLVFKTTDLIKEGYFNKPSKVFLERVGNVVLLPFEKEAFWWYEKGKFEQRYFGHHGGATPKEMESILYAYKI